MAPWTPLIADGFAHPGRLGLLLALAPLAAWAIRTRRRQAADRAALGLVGRTGGDGSLEWLGAFACLILALAQPRWGRQAGTGLPPGHDVVLLVDVSRSMGAEDAVPNRLGLAVEAAEGLLSALGREPGPRAAVVAFAGRGAARCPLTDDLGAAVEALRALRPGEVRPGGTDLGAALGAALDAFDDRESAGGRTVVVLSDGEDHDGTTPRVVPRLRAAQVVVHAVAVGDAGRGHPVPTEGGKPLAYLGQQVESRRVDAPLEALARETGGAFVPMGLAAADLGALYEGRIAPVALRRRASRRAGEPAEWFPLPLLAALGLVLAATRPRRGRGRGRRGARRRLIPAMSLVLLAVGPGAGKSSPAGAIAEGLRASARGDDLTALAAFERAIALDPSAALPRYDAAATLFRLGRFPEAGTRYREARDRADPALRAKVDYASGNTALALGDIPEALQRYDACLASRARSEGLDALRRDAAENRRFAANLSRRPEAAVPTPRPDRPRANPPAESPRPRETPDGPTRPAPPRPSGTPKVGGNQGELPSEGTPEARLDDALQRVRESLKRRPGEGPPPPPDPGLRDW